MGANPEATTIEINTDGDVITVPDGVTVTLKNMAIINTGTGIALSDTGMINLINCIIIENYVEPTVEEPVVEEPVVEEPVVEEPVVEEPVVEEPVVEEPVVENTTEMDTFNDSGSIINDFVAENQNNSISTLEPQSNDIPTQSIDLTADIGLLATKIPTTTTPELVIPTIKEESTTPIIDETPITGINESSTPLEDGSIPLTTMAYGMLMVVGGVVLPRKDQ